MSSIFIPIRKCDDHKKEIQFIILQSNCQEKRLLCRSCDLNGKTNMFNIVNTFEFAEYCQKNEGTIEQWIKKLENDFNILKNNLLTLLNQQENNIKKLKEEFITGPRIIPRDFVSICLEKKNNSQVDELMNMANQLETLMIKQNELSTNRYTKLFSLLKEVEDKLKDLNFQPPQRQRLSEISQNSGIQSNHYSQVNFIEMSEIKLLQQKNINDAQFNKTNGLLALGGSLNNETKSYIQIYQFENNKFKFLCDVNGPKSDVKSICFSNKDDSFFAGEQDQQILLFKQSQPNKWFISQQILGFQSAIYCLALYKKNQILAAGSEKIRVFWENQNENSEWQPLQTLEHLGKQISHLNFSNSEERQLLIAASKDQIIYVFEHYTKTNQFQLINKFEGLTQNVHCLKFYNDYDIYALLQDNSSIYFTYQAQTYEYEKIITKFDQVGSIQNANFNSKSQNLIIKPQNKNEVLIFNISNRNTFILHSQKIQFKADKIFTSLDGTRVVLFGEQMVKVYYDEQDRY